MRDSRILPSRYYKELRMILKKTILALGLAAFLGAGNVGAEETPLEKQLSGIAKSVVVQKEDSGLVKLKKERLLNAAKLVKETSERVKIGKDPVLLAIDATQELTKARLSLATTVNEQIASMKLEVELFAELHRLTEILVDAGKRASTDFYRTKCALNASKIALIEFEAKAKQ
jgi:hypothetical protein